MPEKPIPKKIAEFAIIQALGAGAYGQTYLVKDKSQQQFVLKTLKDGALSDAPARFSNEAWALQRLDHAAFPKFIKDGVENERPYIVMTYAEGKTIKSRIEENIRSQGYFHGLTTILIAQRILEGLTYLHNVDLLHRDIKDDNIIVSSSGEIITIIDLGQCKGESQPSQDQTFWNIGAARFAPPIKLGNPTASNKSHDIFAVGVVCYRMLTNKFPWEVGASEDHGHLRTLMQEQPLVPINELNSSVDPEICEIIESMLEIEDYRRLEANIAINKISIVRNRLENREFPSQKWEGKIHLNRVIRDPLHGDIPMTTFEFGLINTKEFQRLRRIRQLGLANLVYHGAEHTRFSHATGTLYVAEKILRSVEMRDGHIFEASERKAARCYALLHDVAHGPFGHTLEDELGFFDRHDKNEGRIDRLWNRKNAELGNLLQASDFGRHAKDLIEDGSSKGLNGWIYELVGGPTGADVIDYIDRDSLHCGLDHKIDSAIYRRFSLEKERLSSSPKRSVAAKLYGAHGFRIDADHAVTSILRERFALFMKVYSHPVKEAAGAMLGKALQFAILNDPNFFTEERIEIMNDDELLYAIVERGGEDAKFVATNLLNRAIFKPVFRSKAIGDGDFRVDNYREKRREHEESGYFSPDRRHVLENEIAARANVDSRDVIIYCNKKAPGAKTVVHRVSEAEGKFKRRDGAYKSYQTIFNAHLYLWNIYLFVNNSVDEGKKTLLAELFQNDLGYANDIRIDRRQLTLDLL